MEGGAIGSTGAAGPSAVRNAATATIRQVISVLFERAGGASGFGGDLVPKFQEDARSVFVDLCAMCGGDVSSWVGPGLVAPVPFLLEMIETVLAEYDDLFIADDLFRSLLGSTLCPLLFQLLQIERTDFQLAVRLHRIVALFLAKYHLAATGESEVLLGRLGRTLSAELPLWCKCLSLEVLRSIFESPLILVHLVSLFDLGRDDADSPKMMRAVFRVLARFGLDLMRLDRDSQFCSSTARVRLLAAPSSLREAPLLMPKDALLHCLDCVMLYARAAGLLAAQVVRSADRTTYVGALPSAWAGAEVSIPAGSAGVAGEILETVLSSLAPSNAMAAASTSLLSGTYESLAAPSATLLVFLEALLERSGEVALHEELVNTVVTLFLAASMVRSTAAQQRLLGALCRRALPPPATDSGAVSALTERQLSVARSLLRTFADFGSHLVGGYRTLVPVLEVLQRLCGALVRAPAELRGGVTEVDSSVTLTAVVGPRGAASLAEFVAAIFDSSARLSDEAVFDLVDALCLGCLKFAEEIAVNAGAPSPGLQSFYPTQLGVVTARNLSRLPLIWKPIADVYVRFSASQSAQLAALGVDAITRSISSWMDFRARSRGTAANAASAASSSASASSSTAGAAAGVAFTSTTVVSTSSSAEGVSVSGAVSSGRHADAESTEVALMDALDRVTRLDSPVLREKAYVALHALLQAHGELLTLSWPIVLTIAISAPLAGDSAMVPLGFRSVELVVNDFLGYLPRDCVALLITTVARYAHQMRFLNIALSAIGLEWKIADFLSRGAGGGGDKVDGAEASGGFSQHGLWLPLFMELKLMCVDPRPEIRKGAMETLSKTLTTYGHLLGRDAWERTLSSVLLETLDDVQTHTVAASKDKVAAVVSTAADSLTGPMVHHTRDTPRKQWNETKALCIVNVARVVRTHLPALHSLLDSTVLEGAVRRLLSELVRYASTKNEPVYKACMRALLDWFDVSMEYVPSRVAYWEPTWAALEALGESGIDIGFRRFAHKTFATLLSSLRKIIARYRSLFEPADVMRLIRMVEPFAMFTSDTCIRDEPSEVQVEALHCIRSLEPLKESEYAAVFQMLQFYVSFTIDLQAGVDGGTAGLQLQNVRTRHVADLLLRALASQSASGTGGGSGSAVSPPGAGAMRREDLHPLAILAVQETLWHFQSCPSDALRAAEFVNLLKVVCGAAMTKYMFPESALWTKACSAMVNLVHMGLDVTSRSDPARAEDVWIQLYATFEDYLFHDRGFLPPLLPAAAAADVDHDAALCTIVGSRVISMTCDVGTVHSRFIGLLLRGGQLLANGTGARHSLGALCYSILFDLAGGSGGRTIAERVFEQLFTHSRGVFSGLLSYGSDSALPPPRGELVQTATLLRRLALLRLASGSALLPFLPAGFPPYLDSPRAHLWLLYRTLVRFASHPDKEVAGAAAAGLLEIADGLQI